jgi:hypothetical protein
MASRAVSQRRGRRITAATAHEGFGSAAFICCQHSFRLRWRRRGSPPGADRSLAISARFSEVPAADGSSAAQNEGPVLTLEEAEARALQNHPRLMASRYVSTYISKRCSWDMNRGCIEFCRSR